MENKFIVIKREDSEKYLNEKGKQALYGILETISDARSMDNKKCNEYLVVNKNEAYAPLVEKLILHKVSTDDIPEEVKEQILEEYAEDLLEEFQQVERFEGKITLKDIVDVLQINS